jgi:hypothetical protein
MPINDNTEKAIWIGMAVVMVYLLVQLGVSLIE